LLLLSIVQCSWKVKKWNDGRLLLEALAID